MLQGSLDDFALDEMLGLLASTGKTGKLEIKGDRGHGSLRLHQGRLVDAGAANTANGVEPEDVLFELLRFKEGNFHFSVTDIEEGAFAAEIAEVVSAAEHRLADWQTIEAIVPSLRHMVTPVADLPADEITLDRRDWKVLILVGAGCTVSAVCDELNLGEVEGSRQIKALTERGMVMISPPKSSGLRRSGIDATRAAATTAVEPAPVTNSSELNGSTGGSSAGSPDGHAPVAPPINGDGSPGRSVLVDEGDAQASPPPPPPIGPEPAPTDESDGATPASSEVADVAAPPDPDSADVPPTGLSTLAPVVRQPVDAGASERTGGLLMRYLKSDD